MSATSRALLEKARRLVPPMSEKFHKGQLGRVAVVGGSADYTGAPYFSAMASAKLGCDMSHVICEPSAATVIKSYSPNLMVHPILQSTSSLGSKATISDAQNPANNQSLTDDTPRQLAEPIISFLPRLHVLVIGPGLGRDSLTQRIVSEVISEARSRDIPMVMDADALLLIQEQPSLISGYTECILTPNVVEFGRLCKALGVDLASDNQETGNKGGSTSDGEACKRLSNALGGVLIIQKGKHDVISNGVTSIVSDIEGGLKRSGGQGDTLTGSLGTFLAWRKAYHDGLWELGVEKPSSRESRSNDDIEAELYGNVVNSSTDKSYKMSRKTTLLLSAWAGSAITRECSRRAYLAKGRSMQASDLTEEVHKSFLGLIGEPEAPKL